MLKRKLILVAIFIATFMTSIETTIVTTAMPTIISELHGLSIQSWVFAAYLLTTAITTPIYGKLSDRIGRKPIFIFGLAVFVLGSFLCGFAPDMGFLILFRVIQGIGAGAVMPLTFTIIADLFKFEERARVFALNNTAWAISALGGPLLGGYIVDFLNWHWIFFINVPLGIVTLFLTLYAYDEKKRVNSAKKRIDLRGIFALAVTLLMLLLIFQGLSGDQINWLYEGLELLIGLLSFAFFVHSEKKADDPVLQLDLFKNYSFTVQILSTFLISGVIIAYQVYFPIWMQAIYRTPAYLAGVAITPASIMWTVSSFFVGMLMKKFSSRKIAVLALSVFILIYLPVIFSSPSFPQLLFYVISGISGACAGVIITVNTLLAQDLVPKENVGLSSSMIVLARTLGQAMMTGIYGLAFSLGVNGQLSKYPTIKYNDVNNFISTAVHQVLTPKKLHGLENVTLSALQKVFMVVMVLLIIATIINAFDKNLKKDEREAESE
ncbi:MAG: MFS transporter [Streptococcaceae bacterium]|jgi:EmrB/QacA subfamily drug resistance transporter|nr:MFS transporter [Streptococcaceae bacterium]